MDIEKAILILRSYAESRIPSITKELKPIMYFLREVMSDEDFKRIVKEVYPSEK